MRLSDARDLALQYWSPLSARGRAAAAALACVVLMSAGWLLVWRPLVKRTAASRISIAQNAARLEAMRAALPEIDELRAKARRSASASPLTAIEKSADRLRVRVNIKDLSQGADGAIALALESVRFDSLILLIDALRTDGNLRVERAQIEAQAAPGLVTARLTLR